jgi:hypothetical protein
MKTPSLVSAGFSRTRQGSFPRQPLQVWVISIGSNGGPDDLQIVPEGRPTIARQFIVGLRTVPPGLTGLCRVATNQNCPHSRGVTGTGGDGPPGKPETRTQGGVGPSAD